MLIFFTLNRGFEVNFSSLEMPQAMALAVADCALLD